MAHIERIKLEGLQGRKKIIALELHRDVNIFFGENGCGKTTALKILDSAMSLDGDTMSRLPISKAEVDIYSINERATIRHQWSRKDSKNSASGNRAQLFFDDDELNFAVEQHLVDPSVTNAEWKTSGKKRSRSRWAHTFLSTSRLYPFGTQALSSRRLTEARMNAMFSDLVNNSWLVFNSRTLTKVRQIQERGLREVLFQSLSHNPPSHRAPTGDPALVHRRVHNFLSREGSPDSGILGPLAGFTDRYEKEPQLRATVDTLSEIEGEIQEAMKPLENFTSTVAKLFSRGKQLRPSERGLEIELESGEKISPAELSSGEKHLLQILLTALNAESNSVIIDEPELSMHIDWQRNLIHTIQALNPHCQLILASHSPEIMADIEDEKIFAL